MCEQERTSSEQEASNSRVMGTAPPPEEPAPLVALNPLLKGALTRVAAHIGPGKRNSIEVSILGYNHVII